MSDSLTDRSQPLDHLARRGKPGDPALILRDATVTFGELDAMVGRIAGWLKRRVADAGGAPGARVATWLPKTRLACLMPLAAARAGLVHVPINPLLKPPQVAHILADSGAVVLLTPAARAALLSEPPAGCVQIDDALAEAVADGAGEDAGEPLPPSTGDVDALAALLYTSGSTGRPKGVMLSHRNLWLGAESVATYLRLSPADRVLAVLPLAFDYGQNQLLSAWFAGASAAPLDYLTPRDVVRAVERVDATTLAGVPPLWVQLTEVEWPDAVAARLTRLTNSGGALTRRLVGALRTRFPGADLYPMYGLTEAFRSTYLDPALVDAHPESIGRAIPHAEILVCRPDGSITADGEPGELVHCGPLVAQGYWRDAERTAARFRPAPPASRYGGVAVWSGDTVRRDADGLLTFVGRDDAMIKTAGNRVSPTEVEEAAVATGLVAEAVALGIPDERLGAAILLVARATSGEAGDDAALIQAMKPLVPTFMLPARVVWRAALPRNANGKLDRTAIAATEGATA